MTTHDTPEAAAITHREDDKPCGCDGCMEIGAEENGVDWWRLPKADRERLRRNSLGDDRLEPAPIHVYPVGEGHEMSEGCWCHPKVTAVTTHDTPEAALADALDAFDVVDYRIDPHGTPIGHDEAATAILAAMPDMMLVPRVATADWTGSTRKDADKADLYRAMYVALAAKWAALLEHFDLAEDAQPEDIIAAAYSQSATTDSQFGSHADEPKDWEEHRKANGWPTPISMRRTADALDVFTPAKYGDVLRWVADACDAALAPAPSEP